MKLLNYTFSSVWADEIINYITLKEKCGFNLPRLINHFKKLVTTQLPQATATGS